MAKEKENKKKRWRPGRNLLTLILLIIIVVIIFFAIYIPTTISKSYNEGKVEYFQDYENISYISSTYNKDDVIYYDNSKDFDVFEVTLTATSYNDKQDSLYVVGESSGDGDVIKFNLSFAQKDISNPVKFSAISGSYVLYAALCTATNWIGDHGHTASASRYTLDNITNAYSRSTSELKCNVSYPAKKMICWPVSKTVDTPDVYLYVYYIDDYQHEHQYVIRYAYDEYITDSTEGRIIKL